MNVYWDERYEAEGKIWGEEPSSTARYALEIFRKEGIKKILLPGSGYGRNTRLFSTSGFEFTGVEISPVACNIALQFDRGTRIFNKSVLDMSCLADSFDAVYCFNVLHLFLEADRKTFIRECIKKVKKHGLLFFTVFSVREQSFEEGTEVEKNTFESKPGRPAHYFSESDLREHFTDMDVIKTGIIKDLENHGEGPHMHILRYIYAKAR